MIKGTFIYSHQGWKNPVFHGKHIINLDINYSHKEVTLSVNCKVNITSPMIWSWMSFLFNKLCVQSIQGDGYKSYLSPNHRTFFLSHITLIILFNHIYFLPLSSLHMTLKFSIKTKNHKQTNNQTIVFPIQTFMSTF